MPAHGVMGCWSMRRPCAPCNNLQVSTRLLIVAAVCVAVLATRSLGAHAHMSHGDGVGGHPEGLDHHERRHDSVVTTLVEGEAHIHAHRVRGETDLDIPAMAGEKPLPMELPVVAAPAPGMLPVAPASSANVVVLPPYRPPRLRSRPNLLPPAQAPPIAS